MAEIPMPPDIVDPMFRAIEKVDERLQRAAYALSDASISSAVIGAKAVAYWIATVDEGLVRNTPNVDFLIDRVDADGSRSALERVGFVFHSTRPRPMTFLDGMDGRERQAVRLWFVGEVPKTGVDPFPDLSLTIPTLLYRVPSLSVLVRMKLSANRLIDRVHVRDMINARLIEESWLGTFPDELRSRLQPLLDDPDG